MGEIDVARYPTLVNAKRHDGVVIPERAPSARANPTTAGMYHPPRSADSPSPPPDPPRIAFRGMSHPCVSKAPHKLNTYKTNTHN